MSALLRDDLLLLKDHNVGAREVVCADGATGGNSIRLAVLGNYTATDLDELPGLQAAKDDGFGIRSRIGGRVVDWRAPRRVRLPIINGQEHDCYGVPLRVDCLAGVLDVLTILLEVEGLTPGR